LFDCVCLVGRAQATVHEAHVSVRFQPSNMVGSSRFLLLTTTSRGTPDNHYPECACVSVCVLVCVCVCDGRAKPLPNKGSQRSGMEVC
jgi:hypothetical protein